MKDDYEKSERPRHMVMWWARRFSAPLRETFPADPDTNDQLIDLLEAAERRLGMKTQDN